MASLGLGLRRDHHGFWIYDDLFPHIACCHVNSKRQSHHRWGVFDGSIVGCAGVVIHGNFSERDQYTVFFGVVGARGRHDGPAVGRVGPFDAWGLVCVLDRCRERARHSCTILNGAAGALNPGLTLNHGLAPRAWMDAWCR